MISTTQQTLYNGARNLTVQLTGTSDGSGNENNVRKLDVSAFGAKAVALKKITYSVMGGLVKLLWDGSTPIPFAMLQNESGVIDYHRTGGMMNGGDSTGDILLSTAGFGLNSSYMITLELTKKS